MPVKKAPVVIHQHTALMVCKTPMILEELLNALDLESMHIQRLGARAIVAPAQHIRSLQRALNDQGIYPRIVGQPLVEEPSS